MNFAQEFSKYDAGWLHLFKSTNKKDLLNASWDDLNLPARLSTYAAAGIPIIQKDNFDSIVAMQNLCKELNIGIYFSNYEDLFIQLKNKKHMFMLEKNIKEKRYQLSFDYHLPELISFFHKVIQYKKTGNEC